MSYGSAAAQVQYAIPNLVTLIFPVPLVAGRLAIRRQTYGKLFWDDIACLVALLSTIIYSALDVATYRYSYSSTDRSFGLGPSTTAGQLANTFFFCIALWAMDVCILLLYRDLFWVSGKFRKFWYWIVGYLVVSAVASSGFLLLHFEPPKPGYISLDASPALYMNIPITLILLFYPAWVFPSIHLRHSINWGIAWVFIFGSIGYAFALSLTYGSSLAVRYGEPGLYTAVGAVALAAYSPLIMPNKRQKLWPWSKKLHVVGDAEQQVQTARTLKSKKMSRKPTFSSMLSLIRRDSTGHTSLDSVEMGNVRSSFESTRRPATGNTEHGQVRVLEMRL